MATKYGFGDNSHGSQRGGVIPSGGIRVESSCITSTDVSASNYIPTTLGNVQNVIGQVIHAETCASSGAKPITYWCVSAAGQIDVSVLDITVGTSTGVLNLIAVGW